MSTQIDLREKFRIRIRIAEQDFTFTASELISAPDFFNDLNIRWNDGIKLQEIRRIDFEVCKSCQIAENFLIALESNPCPAPVAILDYHKDEEWQEIINAPIKNWTTDDASIRFECDSGDILESEKLVCRDLSLLPSNPEITRTTWLPVVFGFGDGVECVPLFLSDLITSNVTVKVDSNTILTSKIPESWPDKGKIQINDEIISYSTKQKSPYGFSNLERLDPKEHPKSSPIRLLPNEKLRWLACDHPGAVTEVRALEADGNVLAEYNSVFYLLDGRFTTAVERDFFPLFSNLENFTVPTQIGFDADDWKLLEETTALTPRNAFNARALLQDGARLSRNRPTLSAQFMKNFSTSLSRFDQLEKLELIFTVMSNNLWGQTQAINVDVTYNGQSISGRVLRDNVIQPTVNSPALSITSDSIKSASQNINSKLETTFHALNETARSLWSNWETLFNRLDNDTTSLAVTAENADNAKFSFSFLTTPALDTDSFNVMRIYFRVKASTDGLKVRTEVLLPGIIQKEEEFSLGTEMETYYIEVTGDQNPATILNQKNTIYQFEFLQEGTFEFGAVWVEFEENKSISTSIENAKINLSEQEITVTKNPTDLRLDISDLIPAESAWDLFDGSSDAIKVDFVLEGEDSSFTADIKFVHFETLVRPAKDVQLVDEIYADVEGLNHESDSFANPADVITTLIESGFFFNKPNSINQDSLAIIRSQTAAANMRYQAVFRSRFTLEQAAKSALEEALVWLRIGYENNETSYELRRLETSPSNQSLITITEEEIFINDRKKTSKLPQICAGVLQFRDSRTRIFISQFIIGETGDEPFFWPLLWLKKGTETLSQASRALFGSVQESITQQCIPEPNKHAVGSFRNVPELSPINSYNRISYLTQQSMSNGSLNQILRLLPEEFILWQDDVAVIKGRRFPSLITFEIDGILVAVYEERKLKIIGSIYEEVDIDYDQSGFDYRPSTQSIVATAESSGTSVSFELDSSGNLRTTHSIINKTQIQNSVEGLIQTEDHIELNTLSAQSILEIDAALESINIFGSIIEKKSNL